MLLTRIPLESIVFSFHAGHASPCEITPKNLSGGGRQNLDIYHEPCYRLMNTICHLSDEACSQWGVVFGDGVLMNPISISDSVFGMGGPMILFPLLEMADSSMSICIVLELFRVFCKAHIANLEYMQTSGYRVIVFLLSRKKQYFNPDVLRACVSLAIDSKGKNPGYQYATFNTDICSTGTTSTTSTATPLEDPTSNSKVLADTFALRHLALNWELWGGSKSRGIFVMLLSLINNLLSPKNINGIFNSQRLHNVGMVRWTLSVMMQAARLASTEPCEWGMSKITLEEAHWGKFYYFLRVMA